MALVKLRPPLARLKCKGFCFSSGNEEESFRRRGGGNHLWASGLSRAHACVGACCSPCPAGSAAQSSAAAAGHRSRVSFQPFRKACTPPNEL
eukprot:1159070-Pelagomonas_calceolata.AAC.6